MTQIPEKGLSHLFFYGIILIIEKYILFLDNMAILKKPFIYTVELLKGSAEMKKNILTGICSLLFYYFVMHLMLLCEYNENYAAIQNVMIYVLPALPGAVLAVLLIRNSLREFFRSWCVCLLSSVCLFLIWTGLRVDLTIYKGLTGFDEFSLGEGLLTALMLLSYTASCAIGCIIAAVMSFCKKKKECFNTE